MKKLVLVSTLLALVLVASSGASAASKNLSTSGDPGDSPYEVDLSGSAPEWLPEPIESVVDVVLAGTSHAFAVISVPQVVTVEPGQQVTIATVTELSRDARTAHLFLVRGGSSSTSGGPGVYKFKVDGKVFYASAVHNYDINQYGGWKNFASGGSWHSWSTAFKNAKVARTEYSIDIYNNGMIDTVDMPEKEENMSFSAPVTPGTYNYSLMILEYDDAESEWSDIVFGFKSFEVKVKEPNNPPVARASASPSETLVGDTITFDASNSYDSDGRITYYKWTFGDGNSARGATVQHSYSTPGGYNVSLVVKDDNGAEATDTVTVGIQDVAPPPDELPIWEQIWNRITSWINNLWSLK